MSGLSNSSQSESVEPWTRWTIPVCSDCNEPSCEAPSEPAPVEVVPAEEALEDVTRLREALRDAVATARLFNRGGLTWLQYDAALVRWEREARRDPA